jgi:hypothetical protein
VPTMTLRKGISEIERDALSSIIIKVT